MVRSSMGPSVTLLVTIPRAFLKEICIAASISLEHSWAVEFAAATTVATVPSFAEPVPPKEFTASLWALSTNCAALIVESNRELEGESKRGVSREKILSIAYIQHPIITGGTKENFPTYIPIIPSLKYSFSISYIYLFIYLFT